MPTPARGPQSTPMLERHPSTAATAAVTVYDSVHVAPASDRIDANTTQVSPSPYGRVAPLPTTEFLDRRPGASTMADTYASPLVGAMVHYVAPDPGDVDASAGQYAEATAEFDCGSSDASSASSTA
eukprot:CAMPEP_0198359472 /NCGR_PEP_ID=MMETSP1450-20131203/134727_1 /TAXON_ID=753684 ORGANISM="Madagascaria erythrocladiodes, Strain CCMP3234" /NCGR_SAMPLE_ID=MMETSP1450 /ASSEMBLY_ACC=CAM_ASM_001115 /LENGTH=125 /DNA_ID=CAMNT_0044066347 /DNA_START=1 /DNA_END=374 /DNA_ORIENTATION=+